MHEYLQFIDLHSVLLIDPKDEDAIQAKIFALLETEQYTEALAMLEHLGGLNNLAYEKAYALYRLQHEGDAAAILSHRKENEGPNGEHARGVSHLEAQIVSVSLTMSHRSITDSLTDCTVMFRNIGKVATKRHSTFILSSLTHPHWYDLRIYSFQWWI